MFSVVFRGYKMGTLARNGLIHSHLMLLLTPPKNIRKPVVLLCFQVAQKEILGRNGVIKEF